ncbi:MAG: CDP-glycerol glycerophosphotransferase family protein [Parasporobacterium sp.]|nr:CDP-glycerol glycerophosphotransferase family protein [Parasporobacterium sp.]
MQLFHYLNYIDPGTGSMLFTIVIGIATTLFFVLRGVMIKFKFALHGGKAKGGASKLPIVIFTDSKRYWNVFRPICEELDKRKIRCEYWTASEDDPALQSTFQNISCRFIGEGNKAFARLNVMNARICLATTPGLDVLQWKRSKDVDWYVHVFHGLDDGTLYRQFGLDYYDAVLATGPVQIGKLRRLEQLRGLPAREIEIVGSTYLDGMKLRKEESETDAGKSEALTILCAPSWGASSILNKYGEAFIQGLVDTGYHIIIRPHPQSKTSDPELLERLQTLFPDSSHLEWNYDNDNFEVLRKSDLLISDFSGVIFDFCYVFQKPVIYTDTEFDKSPYDADWLEETPWILATLEKIGRQLKKEDISNMKHLIDEVIRDSRYQTGWEETLPEVWGNVGEATVRTADYLERKLKELSDPSSGEEK